LKCHHSLPKTSRELRNAPIDARDEKYRLHMESLLAVYEQSFLQHSKIRMRWE
jgi:hypothetical protein